MGVLELGEELRLQNECRGRSCKATLSTGLVQEFLAEMFDSIQSLVFLSVLSHAETSSSLVVGPSGNTLEIDAFDGVDFAELSLPEELAESNFRSHEVGNVRILHHTEVGSTVDTGRGVFLAGLQRDGRGHGSFLSSKKGGIAA